MHDSTIGYARIVCALCAMCVSEAGLSQTIIWQQTKGPMGGALWDIETTSDNQLFASYGTKGVYRSSDNGKSWVQCGDFVGQVPTLVVNVRGVVLASNDWENCVFRSTDNGDSWSRTNLPYRAQALASDERGDLYAGSFATIYRSTDDGATWTGLNSDLANEEICAIEADSSGQIFVGTRNGLFRSLDQGSTWNHILPLNSFVWTICKNPSGDIFAGSAWLGLFRSTDKGSTWARRGLDSMDIRSIKSTSVGHLFAASETQNPGVYRSTDTGASWQLLGFADNEGSNTLAIANNDNVFSGVLRGGLYQSSDDGESWSQRGWPNTHVRCMTHFKGTIFSGTAGEGIYRSSDSGDSWTLTPQLGGFDVHSIMTTQQGTVLAGMESGGVYYSTNAGSSWIRSLISTPSSVSAILQDSDGCIFAGTDGMFRSTDEGRTWANIAFSDTLITHITFDAMGFVYAASHLGGVYRSTNHGAGWSPAGLAGQHFAGLLADGSRFLLACTDSGSIYRSVDAGDTWSNSSQVPYPVWSFCMDPLGLLYVGTGSGVYRSTDHGDSWNRFNAGLASSPVASFMFDNAGYIFAGSWGDGVYRSVESTTGIEDFAHDTPMKFSLSQNYPNPFNPSTTIGFSISHPNAVTLRIFDVLGEELETLVSANLDAGKYNVPWVPKNLASGIYFYRFQAGTSTETRKLLYLR